MGEPIFSHTNSERDALVEFMGSTTKDDFIRRALAVLEMGKSETVQAVAEHIGATRKKCRSVAKLVSRSRSRRAGPGNSNPLHPTLVVVPTLK